MWVSSWLNCSSLFLGGSSNLSGVIEIRAISTELYDGAPVGVKLLGRQFEDERILGITMEVAKVVSLRPRYLNRVLGSSINP
jgi:Asp-tRNA(Asn)/Glu-tRNA(Gln) amidotransferase A subunit family amidase